jgi:hypothetical protein
VLCVQVCCLRESMSEYSTALDNVSGRLNTYRHLSPSMSVEEHSADIIHDLEQSCDVFEQKLSEQARHMAWVSIKAKWCCVSCFKSVTL